MSFGSNLLELRKRENLSQEELAEKIGVSRQTIYTWEYDQVSPSIENLKIISQFFNITVDELIGQINSKDTLSKANPVICMADKDEVIKVTKKWALGVSIGTIIIIIGIAIFVLFANFKNDIEILPGFIILFIAIAVAVPIFIIGGTQFDSFIKDPDNLNYQILFSKKEKENFTKKYYKTVAIATVICIIAVITLISIYLFPEFDNSVWPVSLFLVMIAIAVFIFIYFGMIISILFTPNKKNDEKLLKNSKISEGINSFVWLITIAIYLYIGLRHSLWHPGWIIFIIAAAISGIIGVFFPQIEKAE